MCVVLDILYKFSLSVKILASNCWQALARQQPILYNSEKKANSVASKIVDMRSRMWLCIQL